MRDEKSEPKVIMILKNCCPLRLLNHIKQNLKSGWKKCISLLSINRNKKEGVKWALYGWSIFCIYVKGWIIWSRNEMWFHQMSIIIIRIKEGGGRKLGVMFFYFINKLSIWKHSHSFFLERSPPVNLCVLHSLPRSGM